MFIYIICAIVHIIYYIIYMPIFVDLVILREVDGIHFLAILKNTAINLDLQNALKHTDFQFFWVQIQKQLLTHMVIIFFKEK